MDGTRREKEEEIKTNIIYFSFLYLQQTMQMTAKWYECNLIENKAVLDLLVKAV